MDHRAYVEIEHRIDERIVELGKRASRDQRTGVVDEQVQAPERFRGLPHQHRGRVAPSEIGAQQDVSRCRLRQSCEHGASLGFVLTVMQRHARALRGECRRGGRADAGARASDQDPLVGKIVDFQSQPPANR